MRQPFGCGREAAIPRKVSVGVNFSRGFCGFYRYVQSAMCTTCPITEIPGGGGGSQEKFSSQRVRRNLKRAILCGKYPWKLYPLHTIHKFIGFQITNKCNKCNFLCKKLYIFQNYTDSTQFTRNFKSQLNSKMWTSAKSGVRMGFGQKVWKARNAKLGGRCTRIVRGKVEAMVFCRGVWGSSPRKFLNSKAVSGAF